MKTLLSIIAMLGALFSAPADASMVALSQDQLVDASTAIVRGKITEVWTEEDERGVVWTRAQVEVEETYKGNTTTKAYIIDQLGGRFGGNVTAMDAGTRFSVGEEAIFFLETLGNGRTSTVGLSQGKFTTRMDPYSQEKIVVRFAPMGRLKYDHRFIPLPKAEDRVYMADFVDRIQTRVEQGWDGSPIPGISNDRLRTINTERLRNINTIEVAR